ncbi:MAG: putative bifunctional diguanylate cyclase/phosphodiesterase [Gaiellaceae bacterium]
MRVPCPNPLRPVGLLGKFAIVSLILIVLLGLALAHVLRGEVRQRALADARQSAVLLEQSLVQPRVSADDLGTGLSGRRIDALDRALEASLAGKQIARIKIWNRDERVAYASDHTIIGRTYPASSELRAALAGRTASEVSNLGRAENTNDRSFGQLLEVYTPLRFGTAARPAGVFELYLPYRPIAAAIDHDTTELSLVLLAGLALLYVALFRIVARASARLRRQARENEHLALHDPLTDLPNRSFFHDRAAQAILGAKRGGGRAALILFDLDRFKEVNDTLGHHNGDLLLKQIGLRLGAALREGDSVARLGGDEFGVLLPSVADADAALAVAEKLRQTFREPVCLDGIVLDLEASAGIALYPEHGHDVETLLQRADVAMYLAKHDHSGCELYSAGRDQYSPARLALVAELRRAIDQRELVLYYQPKADLRSGRVDSVEALIRWQHPERGLLLPDAFIPLAERTGLIRELTLSVLDAALRQLCSWQEDGLELCVSVNLSARDLLDLQLPDTIRDLLGKYELQGERLELEITETVILADPTRARLILSRLSAMGVQLAIDDFGSGYSSLAYLKRLPIGEIKIDRSFVMNMEQDENDAVIVRSTIDLGRNLGLRVVAEGVESEAIWNDLARLGCDRAQGYYLSRAVPGQALAEWMRERETTSRPILLKPASSRAVIEGQAAALPRALGGYG